MIIFKIKIKQNLKWILNTNMPTLKWRINKAFYAVCNQPQYRWYATDNTFWTARTNASLVTCHVLPAMETLTRTARTASRYRTFTLTIHASWFRVYLTYKCWRTLVFCTEPTSQKCLHFLATHGGSTSVMILTVCHAPTIKLARHSFVNATRNCTGEANVSSWYQSNTPSPRSCKACSSRWSCCNQNQWP